MDFHKGDYVVYQTQKDNVYKKEIGRVKGTNYSGDYFVVYNCADDWDNYEDYTGACTKSEDLRIATEEEINELKGKK